MIYIAFPTSLLEVGLGYSCAQSILNINGNRIRVQQGCPYFLIARIWIEQCFLSFFIGSRIEIVHFFGYQCVSQLLFNRRIWMDTVQPFLLLYKQQDFATVVFSLLLYQESNYVVVCFFFFFFFRSKICIQYGFSYIFIDSKILIHLGFAYFFLFKGFGYIIFDKSRIQLNYDFSYFFIGLMFWLQQVFSYFLCLRCHLQTQDT